MRTNVPTDLWRRVQIGASDECWPWIGGCRPNGYGIFSLNGRNVATHRLAYELGHGVAPGDRLVCHSCDNHACCNPAHLFLGTNRDNTHDALTKGRLVFPRGARHGQSRLTERQVVEIRRRRAAGERGIDLAREFGVDPSTITKAVRGVCWGWLEREAREEIAA